MKFKTHLFITALLLIFSTSMAWAQEEEESLMTYDLAMQAMGAAEAYAREQGWNVTILITDTNNNPVMLHRIDGAGARTFSYATAKALVVNATGMTSGEYGQQVEAGEREEIEGGVTFAGGVPVFRNGVQIGAIATSGVRAAQDEEVSTAGAEAIGSISN
ncbi:MAG: heme-binding protein [Gammaproteobacteria bacterium]|nr:heme-binding protein [Gammaproteobacteria bacterium]MCY4358654.1 heme-binding protein [Gammaproteobacteria bacterium]